MSNSYRKTPIIGCSLAASDKYFKQKSHRRERRLVKVLLQQDRWLELPHPKKFGNVWDSQKDDKMWFGDLDKHVTEIRQLWRIWYYFHCKQHSPGKYKEWTDYSLWAQARYNKYMRK